MLCNIESDREINNKKNKIKCKLVKMLNYNQKDYSKLIFMISKIYIIIQLIADKFFCLNKLNTNKNAKNTIKNIYFSDKELLQETYSVIIKKPFF